MKNWYVKCVLLFLVLGLGAVSVHTESTFAATVGQKLTAPEAGWQRFDDTNEAIKYSGNWSRNSASGYYGGTTNESTFAGSHVDFSFTGTKIRIIAGANTDHTILQKITIDGVTETFTLRRAAGYQYVSYEKTGLSTGYHNVTINSTDSSLATLDAIDIDSNGQLSTSLLAEDFSGTPGSNQVQLKWSFAKKDTISISLKRALQSGGPYTTIANNLSANNYLDKDVVNGQTYYYMMTTQKDGVQVAATPEIIVTPKSIFGMLNPLLQGKIVQPGNNQNSTLESTTFVTDNNADTYYAVKPEVASGTISDFLIYNFETPQTINAFRLQIKDYTNQPIGIGFIDSKNKETFLRYTDGKQGIDGNIYFFPNTMTDIKKVYVWNYSSSSKNLLVSEWEMYGLQNTLTATNKKTSVYLTWTGISAAKTYTIKRSTVAGGPYTTIATDVSGLNYNDKSITDSKKYYYIVEASIDNYILASNEASGNIDLNATEQTDPETTPPSSPSDPTPTTPSNPTDPGTEPSTPSEPVGNRAILTITMINGLQQEFDLPMSEVTSFVKWYDGKGNGTGSAQYAINKHDNNKGPFTIRKSYVIFNNILTFDIDEYS